MTILPLCYSSSIIFFISICLIGIYSFFSVSSLLPWPTPHLFLGPLKYSPRHWNFQRAEFKFQFFHLLVVWPWTGYLTPLKLSFLICYNSKQNLLTVIEHPQCTWGFAKHFTGILYFNTFNPLSCMLFSFSFLQLKKRFRREIFLRSHS